MSFAWCEWICQRCGNIHRLRFDIRVEDRGVYRLQRPTWKSDGIRISDIAFNLKEKPHRKRRAEGSVIYCEFDTPIWQLKAVLSTYLTQFYALQKDSLKVEICTS